MDKLGSKIADTGPEHPPSPILEGLARADARHGGLRP
jgi:hypothetical protein